MSSARRRRALVVAAACALAAAPAPTPAPGQQPEQDCANLPTTLELRLLVVAQRKAATLRAPGSRVEGCDEPGDPISLSVAWGDGTTEPATLEPSPSDDRAFTVVAEHTYERSGRFPIVIRQRNERTGVTRNDAHYEAHVQPAGRIVRRRPLVAVPGRRFEGPVTRIPTVGEGFFRRPSVRIAWGDGTTSRGRVVIRAGRTVVVGRHRWPGRLRARRVVVTVRETVSGAVLRIVRPVRVAG